VTSAGDDGGRMVGFAVCGTAVGKVIFTVARVCGPRVAGAGGAVVS